MDFSTDTVTPILLLFSLTGGYVFIRTCYITKFRAEGREWAQNLFEAALIGGALFVLSRIFTIPYLERNAPDLIVRWSKIRPTILIAHVGTLMLALITGGFLAIVLNRFFPQDWAIRFSVARYGDELVQLLHSAAVNGDPVSLTMANRKVYVGFVISPPSLKYPYTRILPTLSGHRDQATLKLIFDTKYFPVYEALEKKRATGQNVTDDENFGIVLPLNQICSANFFDNDIYIKHFKAKGSSRSKKKLPPPLTEN